MNVKSMLLDAGDDDNRTDEQCGFQEVNKKKNTFTSIRKKTTRG